MILYDFMRYLQGTLPNDHVRKVGDLRTPDPVRQAGGKEKGLLMKLLRKSRPKWSDRDVYAAGAKLEAIKIMQVEELLEAAEKELKGQQGGVNQRPMAADLHVHRL